MPAPPVSFTQAILPFALKILEFKSNIIRSSTSESDLMADEPRIPIPQSPTFRTMALRSDPNQAYPAGWMVHREQWRRSKGITLAGHQLECHARRGELRFQVTNMVPSARTRRFLRHLLRPSSLGPRFCNRNRSATPLAPRVPRSARAQRLIKAVTLPANHFKCLLTAL